jgi:heat shock protein HslJ
MTMRLLLLPVLPVLALLLAACGGGDDPFPIDLESPPGLPAGEFVAGDLPAPYGPGDAVRVTFAGREVTFQATCNTMSGSAFADDDGVLTVRSVGGTEMGCPGQGFEQDEWLVDFFTSKPVLETLDLGFSLSGGGTTLRFLPPEASPAVDDEPLEGTLWRLAGVEERDGDAVGMTVVPRRTDAWLRIAKGELRFDTGCNSGGGDVRVEGDRLRFRRVVVTTAGCLGPGAELEGPQVEVLVHRQAAWAVDGDQLRISRGPTALLYTAR